MTDYDETSLSASKMLAEVCAELGVGKEAFQDVADALERLVESLNRDAALHAAGVLRTKSFLQTCLRQRHALKATRASHPGSFRRAIERPMIILGLPRSGATLLHHLLNQDEGNRTPRLWELSYPLPPPEPATYTSNPRIALTQHDLELAYVGQPDLLAEHYMHAQEPEECTLIFNRCLFSTQFLSRYAVSGYAQWLWSQPLADYYRWYKDELLLLQTNVLGRWVLKSAFHQWGIEAVHTEFPDALLVQTHRDPLEMLASGAHYCEALRRRNSDRVDPLLCGSDWSDMVQRYTTHFEAWKAQHATQADRRNIVEISYRSLMADPLGTITRLYSNWGKKLGLDARMRMQAWLKLHPQGVQSAQRIDPARYGLDAAVVQRDMAGYIERNKEFF